MIDEQDILVRGLISRCQAYLKTKAGKPRKKLGAAQVMISARQLKYLVDQSNIKSKVYGKKPY